MDSKEKIKHLPQSPGVYLMRNDAGEIIYVGKAALLRKRVASYFSKNVSSKTAILSEHIADIEYIECSSEEQALILEAALIKEKKPKYNIALRDGKSYPCIEITKETFPRVFISRPKKKTNSILFGPYPRAALLKPALTLIRRIFPFRSCRNMPKHACLFFHLRLCPGPCIAHISILSYQEYIEAVIKILRGERKELIEQLQARMDISAKQNRFEEAAGLRDKLLALHNLYQGKAPEHELIALKEFLHLPSIPLVIEAVDISCLSGKEATGSVVVFKDGFADKNAYRRYRIKETHDSDDYAMMREVVRRRYGRQLQEHKRMPDLIVIDGGLAHAQVAKEELDKLKLTIPLIGLAKQNEEIWFPGAKTALTIAKNNPALHVIQRVRDEAHRFARKYHLLLRSKRIINKGLEGVVRVKKGQVGR
ncbi:MAG: excinuclease ABC subunit UvrC [Candidatus Omnitrophota bacterium]